MQDTLNLVGDGDDLDVIFDVERAFGIKLSNGEAEKPVTVGQLYDLIESKYVPTQRRACLSQAAFYRLRNAIRVLGVQSEIRPDTPITVLNEIEVGSIHRKWKVLAGHARLDLPPLEGPPWPEFFERHSRLINAVLCLLLIAAIAYMGILFPGLSGGWLLLSVPIAAVLGTAVAYIWHRILGRVPSRIRTLGDLAREAAGYSFEKLFVEKNGSSPHDRWFALNAILRRVSGHKRPITAGTTFFARAPKPSV
jgi:hypothetical protein